MTSVNILIAIVLILMGLLFSIIGFLHQYPNFSLWDAQSFLFVYTRLRRYSSFFAYIWPLGTVPVGITQILIMFITSWLAGLITAFVYVFAAIAERAIKLQLKRPRPYESLPGIVMSQPKNPNDPSHPSGDTMRVWFMALVFPIVFELPWPVFALTLGLALTLSLGRIVLGVHYPLDVIGGAGLGLCATGIYIIAYQLIDFSFQSSVFSL